MKLNIEREATSETIWKWMTAVDRKWVKWRLGYLFIE